jgi:hypothetical protein
MPSQQKVIGGRVHQNPVPWIIELGIYKSKTVLDLFLPSVMKKRTHRCGGIILKIDPIRNETYILTAGHCLLSDSSELELVDKNTLGVGFGNSIVNIYNNGRTPIFQFAFHPEYLNQFDKTYDDNFDLALIKLNQTLKANGKFKPEPACINAKIGKIAESNDVLEAFGYGVTRRQVN